MAYKRSKACDLLIIYKTYLWFRAGVLKLGGAPPLGGAKDLQGEARMILSLCS